VLPRPTGHSWDGVQVRKSFQVSTFAQKLGQLQPFIAAFPQACMGQLAYCANLTPSSLQYYLKAEGYGVVYVFRPNATEASVRVVLRVRKTPSWPRSWANFSLS
jgi:hypothetical protein